MKTIVILIVGALTCWAAASTKIRTSLEVVGESLEDRIVSAAGKGRVAIRLHEKRVNHLRESLINIKALRKFYEAKLKDLDEEEFNASPLDTERIKDYRIAVKRLSELEAKGEREFTAVKKRHQDISSKVIYLEEKLALLRAIANAGNEWNDRSIATSDIDSILNQLEIEVYRSEAALAL